MPDRMIRDELIDSDRYCELSTDTARILFVHLILLADDCGNVDAGDRFIRRRALPSAPDGLAVAKILSELADQDLIRLYQVDGKQYAHIPRFRQRLRSIKRGHPRPPASIECKEIKQMIANLSDKWPTNDGQQSDICQTLVAEGRKEEKEEKEGICEKPPSASGKAKRGCQVPFDVIPGEYVSEANRLRPELGSAEITAIGEQFVDYHRQRGTLGKDWLAGWRTWLRNDEKFSKAKATSHAQDPYA